MNNFQGEYNIFICPACKNDLAFSESSGAVDPTGAPGSLLHCPICKKDFPIIRGLPRFVPEQNYSKSFGFQWNLHPHTQLDSKSGLFLSRERFVQVTRWPNQMEGQRILEAGSGAGRFTEIVCQSGAKVFSFDYSYAIEVNYNNNGHYHNLSLFQADIAKIPFPSGFFDKVFCFGVLQHTSNPEASFHSLVQVLKPGGEIAIDVYHKSLSVISWKYLLRPLTKRMKEEFLYSSVQKIVPLLIPLSRMLKKYLGRVGGRLVPIAEYSNLGLSPSQKLDWAILDTFDMYSGVHDHPQTIKAVTVWFEDANLKNIGVQKGPNGIIGRGVKC